MTLVNSDTNRDISMNFCDKSYSSFFESIEDLDTNSIHSRTFNWANLFYPAYYIVTDSNKLLNGD